MNKLISLMASIAAWADGLLAVLLCALGLHDPELVYPAGGAFARWTQCKRPGCCAQWNHVRRAR